MPQKVPGSFGWQAEGMLQATTLLGDNTIPILRRLLDALRSHGVEVAFDNELPADERESAARAGRMDLVFACGLLTVNCLLYTSPSPRDS